MTSTSQTPPTQLAIVGAGRVGRAIEAAAHNRSLAVSLHGRDRPAGSLASAAAVLICTGDDQIEALAAELADELTAEAIIGHTSGATPLAALAPAAERCAGAFVLHPLQTIPSGQTSLAGVPGAVSASDSATQQRAEALASALGLEPFAIAEQDRAAYHAAATIASNFLFTLEESAAELLERAGVETARKSLSPLVLASAANWAEHGAAALTGPIARGDEATVERQRRAIAERAPELLAIYDALAERTRALAANAEPVG